MADIELEKRLFGDVPKPKRKPVAVPGFPDQPKIDLDRPMLLGKSGDVHTELKMSFEADGRHIVIPSIVEGQILSPESAWAAFLAGDNPAVGVFETQDEMQEFLRARDEAFEKARRGEVDRFRRWITRGTGAREE
jgi:hypothetical protein